ncbi:Arc family DNA-binding protein [Streptomyces sp. NPDC058008]|uniref:Arc family DNA-binding protein n=1 Tax=Streptomyces sp. NPDC058008 TaxID=3346303 RepID=UPI0036F0D0D5
MIRITLRLPDDVHARLVIQSEVDRRSLNSEVVHLLEAALLATKEDAAALPRDQRPPRP